MKDEQNWVVLAHVLRPQGRKGEVLAELSTDFPERFAERKSLVLLSAGEIARKVTLRDHWMPMGKNAGRIVLHFEGVDSISDAELLAGMDVVIAETERVPLEEGTYYVSDLVGCSVVDGDHTLGVVRDVHFPTDAHGVPHPKAVPVLVVERPNGDELMIPLAKEFLQNPDFTNKRIEMRLPDGLLEING
jgi:16S rRNA processing protein RimM